MNVGGSCFNDLNKYFMNDLHNEFITAYYLLAGYTFFSTFLKKIKIPIFYV